MEFGVTFAPLVGPPVGAARLFRDWIGVAEQVCATLERAGFRFVVFTPRGLWRRGDSEARGLGAFTSSLWC